MWTVDEQGNIVYVPGLTRGDVQGPRQWGFIPPDSPLGQTILESKAGGGGGVFSPTPSNVEDAIAASPAPPAPAPSGLPSVNVSPDWRQPTPSPGPLDLTSLFLDGTPEVPAAGGGYTPSLVDTSAAEALLRFDETPEERASIEQLIADLEARATAGTEAVRQGWSQVQAVNSKAAAKAAQMARESGPEAGRLWLDAANTALTLSRQAAEVAGTTPGMQKVNISPTAGAERIAGLLAAEAPRAQAFAERMGLASAEQIAAQARTAAMMGEAYAGEIQRTSIIQANQARQAHNERVFARTSEERQLGAQMRFNAAQANAQLLSSAAAQAVSGAATPESRRERMRNLISDVRDFANIDPLEGEPRNGIAALMGIYGFDAPTARRLIIGARDGTLDWESALAAIG